MMLITHAAFGALLAFLWRYPVLPFVVGAVLPDVDSLVAYAIPSVIHRGFVHTPLTAVVVSLGFFLATRSQKQTLALLAGYLSHLVLDTLTPLGVPWLYPLTETPYSLNMVYTRNLAANAAMLLAFFVIYLIVNRARGGSPLSDRLRTLRRVLSRRR